MNGRQAFCFIGSMIDILIPKFPTPFQEKTFTVIIVIIHWQPIGIFIERFPLQFLNSVS